VNGALRIEELPPAAGPNFNCPQCQGNGVLTFARGEWAFAELCGCVPFCGRCGGMGLVQAIVDGEFRSGRCGCQRLPDRILRFNAARIPGRYAHATSASFHAGAAQWGPQDKFKTFMRVQTWLGGYKPGAKGRGLVIHGAVGRGKTHLLVGLLRDLIIHHGASARFIEFSRLLASLKQAYSERRSEAPVFDELADADVLAIDELGKGRLSDWELQVIDEVISRRYNAMALTLATTNFRPGAATGAEAPNAAVVDQNPQTLGDRVGDRVYSRLREMCEFVELGGRDMREPRA
jgi:DNA replication protein DnaC